MPADKIRQRQEFILQVEGLCKSYEQRDALLRARSRIVALDSASLRITAGETLALVGGSGSGKSTLARCLVRLEEPDAGEIWFEGRNVCALGRSELDGIRQRIQIIFQDPATSLNPRFCAADVVAEPLLIQKRGTRAEIRRRALNLMEQVGLPTEWATRRPLEFSGGQRQRLAIARALALEPRILVLDEAFSALDVSVQAQMVNLLLDLQQRFTLTLLLITHDLALAGQLADEIAVMHGGRIVECAPTAQLFTNPAQPESQALLAALPVVETT
ncbi:MAG TPA: ATP-binding cassette domain-containing protein [Candidatus Dormibacteraeota bacterium]|nr:ATP-binding cassette domain-containing protein [Candidatus Dormibacteraeota bacterium]